MATTSLPLRVVENAPVMTEQYLSVYEGINRMREQGVRANRMAIKVSMLAFVASLAMG